MLKNYEEWGGIDEGVLRGLLFSALSINWDGYVVVLSSILRS
jgi:hypothetical protein